MFALLDVRSTSAEFVFNGLVPFGIIVLEKEVVKMSPIEWILVMLIVISSGVTIWTMIVDKKGGDKERDLLIYFQVSVAFDLNGKYRTRMYWIL